MRRYPSWCCQRCGAYIGYLGRFMEWVYPRCGLFRILRHPCPQEGRR